MAAPHETYDVFLSHAGEQKRPIVDAMHTLLRQVPGVRVFLDEHSLVPGDAAWSTVVDAARRTRVAVVVLTRDFAGKWAPMEELRIFLERHADPNDALVIVPVLPEDTWETFKRVEQNVYIENDRPGHGWPKGSRPDDSTREAWAARIRQLVELTCVRGDQEAYYQGKLASRVVDVVVRRLVALGRLPVGFTWETAVNWEWVHLPARCLNIVGRDEEVGRVVAALEGRHKAAVLVGAAGIGKSTVAREAAWELCVRGRCTGGAFVVDFAGFQAEESPKERLASSLYAQLKLCTGLRQPEDGTWDSIIVWLKTCARGSVLLLLENFEDVTARLSDEGHDLLIKELLEMFRQLTSISGRHGRTVLLLIGSRYYNYPLIRDAVAVQVGALPLEAAEALLKDTASGAVVDWGDGLPTQLAELLECHPLSMDIIASFIKQGRCTPQGVVDSMLEAGRVAGAVPSGSRCIGVRPRLEDGRISQQWLQEILREDELRVLAVVSVFRGSFSLEGALAVDACSAELEVTVMQESLQGLVALNLLRQEVTSGALGGRYSMHLLIRELAVDMSARAPEVHLRWLSWMAEDEQGPGQLLLRHGAKGPDPDLGVVREVMLHEQLNFREVLHVLQGVMCHEGHQGLLKRLSILGRTMLEQGDYAGAGQLQEAVLRKLQQLLGDDHPDTLTSMNNLACAKEGQGDLAGARQLHETVLQKLQQLRGDDHPSTLTSKSNLAGIMQKQGDLAGARQLQEAVLQTMQQVLGNDSPDTLTSMSSLARIKQQQGDLAGARQLQEVALQKRQQLQGDNHPDTLTSMNDLAATKHEQGDLGGAHQLQEAVLQKMQQLLGKDHHSTLTCMGNLAATKKEQGDLAGARQLLEDVLQRQQQVQGDDHPDTLTSMTNLAVTMWQEGDLAGARQLQEAVLQKRQQLHGDDHPLTLTSMNNLAATKQEQGDLVGALQLHEAVLQKMQKLLGNDHPSTLTSMHNLATTKQQQGDLAGARQLQEAVLQKRQQVLGDDHPDKLSSMYALARTKYLQGDLAGARQLREALLQKQQQLLGDDHPDTLTSMNNLAVTKYHQGDLAGARKLQEAVLQKRQQLLGDDHPDTITSMANWAAIDELVQQRKQGTQRAPGWSSIALGSVIFALAAVAAACIYKGYPGLRLSPASAPSGVLQWVTCMLRLLYLQVATC